MKSISFRNKTINYAQRDSFWETLDSWEPDSFDVLDKYIKPGHNFIDIGAWNGVLSVYAGLLGANVYSIEPDMLAFYELVENASLNRSAKITPIPIAISDKTGRQQLNSRTTDGFGNSESSLIERDMNAIETEVITMTLSDYFENFNIDINKTCLIKMDCEGSEKLIIKESAEWLKRYKPTMFISFHPAWFSEEDIQELVDILHPIYNIDFKPALKTEHQHSFIFIA